MVLGSADKCDTCYMEYNKSTDENKCIAKVEYCKDMINGQIDKC